MVLASSESVNILCNITIFNLLRVIFRMYKKGGCCVIQTINLGSIRMVQESIKLSTCVFVLRATVSCYHTFVSGAKGVRNQYLVREGQ